MPGPRPLPKVTIIVLAALTLALLTVPTGCSSGNPPQSQPRQLSLEEQERAEIIVCNREYVSRMRDLRDEENRAIDNALHKELSNLEIKQIQQGFQERRRQLTDAWERRGENIRAKYAQRRLERKPDFAR